MKVTLIKKFGKHDKGTTLDANKILYKHLLGGSYIRKPKVKTPKK